MLPTFLEFETFLSVHVPGWTCGLLKGKVDRQREKPHFLLRAHGGCLSPLRDSLWLLKGTELSPELRMGSQGVATHPAPGWASWRCGPSGLGRRSDVGTWWSHWKKKHQWAPAWVSHLSGEDPAEHISVTPNVGSSVGTSSHLVMGHQPLHKPLCTGNANPRRW